MRSAFGGSVTRSTSDPSLLTMDHARGLRGRVDFAVVMKCEEGHERSRSLPYGKEIRLALGVKVP